MKKVINPRLMLIVSMTIFGTLGIFVRNIPVSSGELALYRAILDNNKAENFIYQD